MSDGVNVYIGAPDGQTAVSVSSADTIYVTVSAGFTGSGGGGGGNTNLSTTRTATTVTVNSDTGTDATIAAADGTNAGVMTSAMFTKLDAINTAALVPYTGATQDVNLGEHGVQLGNLEFDNTPTNTPTSDGAVFWDSGDGTLQLQMKGGVIQQVGMNQFARVYNDTASAFTKGQVVYISGAQGNRIAAKLAQADSELTSRGTLGFVTESIAAGAEGNIIVSGPLYKLNTIGLTAGNSLYLSATTAGAYTETPPQAPDNGVVLGYVERVHATVGSIYVKVDNGYELEELHDVDLTESKATPIDADAVLLQDSADSSVWKRLTWANLKATLLSYFNGEYVAKNAAITGATKTKITYDAKGLVTAGADAAIADITGLQTALDGKVDENAAITGATKTKITYDAKGLVTAGADATTADIADSTNRRYVTDAQQTVIGNTSGANTGDQTITLTGDVTGSGTGSFAATIAADAVTNSKLANMATATIKGRTTAGSGDPEDLTGTQATTLLDTFTSSLKGLAPASGGGTSNFLRADGTWAAPSGGGGGGADGTVLSPSQITAWQNNYNPSGWANTVGVLRINSNQFHFLSGLTATTDGHTVRIFNTGSFPIGLYNQNTDSTAANRFLFDDHDVIILPQNSVELYYDGTAARWSLAAGWTLNSESQFVSKYWNEAFSTAGDNHGATAALWGVSGGTATASTTGNVTGARVGIVDLATGTGATGRAHFYASNNQAMTFDDGTGKSYMEFKAEFRSPAALSDATNDYLIHAGFIDTITGEPPDGAYLKYTHSLNSGQWQFLTANNTTRTTGNSTVAMAVNTWYCVRVVMYPNGTAEFYIDGVSLGRNTADMPANARDFSFGIGIRKTAGTTSRNMLIDGVGYTVVKYRK